MTAPAHIRHVYVHAPFCARRCVYCDFAVKVDRSPNHRRWLSAVAAELEGLRARGAPPLAPVLDTLYVGGGTPSLLAPRFAADLAGLLGRARTAGPELEWTAEANPESFGAGVAQAWAAAGVNRVSLGVQSFDPGALRWMGRLHAPQDAEAAVKHARTAGIANVSIDLIFGLPDSTPRSWPDDLERALALDVPHVSLYGLAVEKGTRLFRQVSEGRSPPPSEGRYQEEYLLAAQLLADAGYDHYEVSNFARPGFASRHNQAYWNGVSYLGLGNGAHSFHAGRRWWNERDWDAYAAAVADGGDGQAGDETLSAPQSRLERVWLGLQTARGLELDAASHRAAHRVAQRWDARGLAVAAPNRVRLTPQGWLLLDALAVELDQALDPGAAVSDAPPRATRPAALPRRPCCAPGAGRRKRPGC